MPTTMAESDRLKYFASLPLEQFLPLLFERIDHYYNHVMESGLLALWRASHMARYSGFYVGGRMNEVGPNGKFTALEANEYANLGTHVLNMITSQKSQPQAQAKNLDHESQQQTIIANGLAETLSDTKRLERVRQDVAEMMLYYGEGWACPVWDKNLGDIIMTEPQPSVDEQGAPVLDEQGQPKMTDHPIRAGDLSVKVYHPLDMVRDATRDCPGEERWLTGRGYANRYDLMASYPAQADRISRLPSAAQQLWDGKHPRLYQWYNLRKDDCDEVVVWDFMHEKTPAMPEGRHVVALAPDLAIVDEPLPYRELPHNRESSANIQGTVFGYTLFYDLLALQQGINAGVSAVATRIATFGLPTITGSPNTKLENLGDGMTCLTVGPGEEAPSLIDFAQVPEGVINFIKMLRDLASTYSGINSVARGEATGGVTAASALALLEARAIQFAALTQKADIEFMKRLFTTSLHHFQDHANGDILVKMVGDGNKARVQTFTADKISNVSGYTIEIGNALQGTTAGRMQLADGMKQSGVPMKPEQYLQVATTGRLDPITKGAQAEEELIASENEAMGRGEEVHALISDNHPLHLLEHTVLDADPESRKNTTLMQLSLRHKQEHMALWEQATLTMPALLAAKGIPPSPMPVPLPGAIPPGAIASPPGAPNGPPPPGAPGKTNVPGPEAPPQPGGGPVRTETARPAKNPLTGLPNPHPGATA